MHKSRFQFSFFKGFGFFGFTVDGLAAGGIQTFGPLLSSLPPLHVILYGAIEKRPKLETLTCCRSGTKLEVDAPERCSIVELLCLWGASDIVVHRASEEGDIEFCASEGGRHPRHRF